MTFNYRNTPLYRIAFFGTTYKWTPRRYIPAM